MAFLKYLINNPKNISQPKTAMTRIKSIGLWYSYSNVWPKLSYICYPSELSLWYIGPLSKLAGGIRAYSKTGTHLRVINWCYSTQSPIHQRPVTPRSLMLCPKVVILSKIIKWTKVLAIICCRHPTNYRKNKNNEFILITIYTYILSNIKHTSLYC